MLYRIRRSEEKEYFHNKLRNVWNMFIVDGLVVRLSDINGHGNRHTDRLHSVHKG